ncbi:MAG: hypothetical protein QOE97_266 [Pseudonocardiales bacterium]|jgi:hypothetical protein|nr:hypothetical protein [Pseudonocardiales bacterium]
MTQNRGSAGDPSRQPYSSDHTAPQRGGYGETIPLPPYGEPVYAQSDSGPPATVSGGPGAPVPPGRRRRTREIAAAVAVVVVAGAVFAYLLLSGSGGTSGANDAAKGPGGAFRPLPAAPGSAVSNLPSVPVPVLPSGSPARSGGPSLPASLPSSLPNGISLCGGAPNSLAVAVTYMQAAAVGFGNFAQSCVYPDTVRQATTDRVAGKLYAPATTDVNATSVPFRSTDGASTVTVTTAKRDGKFYVVGVQLG